MQGSTFGAVIPTVIKVSGVSAGMSSTSVPTGVNANGAQASNTNYRNEAQASSSVDPTPFGTGNGGRQPPYVFGGSGFDEGRRAWENLRLDSPLEARSLRGLDWA